MTDAAKSKSVKGFYVELKWDLRQRLAMLEATALWEGRVSTPSLKKLFGISRGQASKDFAVYHRLAPENLTYDLNRKAYLPTEHFQPRFIDGTIEEYLHLIEAGHKLGPSVALPIVPPAVNVALVRPPERTLDLDALRVISQAIRERRQFAAMYQSVSREPRLLLLEPHTLMHSGYRWHVRAYSFEHTAFRDFVLARFLSVPQLGGSAAHLVEEDTDWQTFESLVFAPHPSLSAEQQAVIADEYGMQQGRLELTVRKASVFYLLRMLHLDDASKSDDPKAQRIVLVHRGPAADNT